MNSWAVRGWILFAAMLAMLYAGWISVRYRERSAEGGSLESASTSDSLPTDYKVHDFRLTDQAGQSFGLDELKGKVWVASFFFASCPGTCRQLNMALAEVQNQTPADVKLVSLTCDPDNDTPETLTRYAEIFHADPARWKFLTGKMSDLRRVGRDIFKVAFDKGFHSEKAFVVDRDGRIRGIYSVLDRAQADNLTKFVRELDTDTAPVAEASPASTEVDSAPVAAVPSPEEVPSEAPAESTSPDPAPATTQP